VEEWALKASCQGTNFSRTEESVGIAFLAAAGSSVDRRSQRQKKILSGAPLRYAHAFGRVEESYRLSTARVEIDALTRGFKHP